jgi:hypothetical protein
MTIPQMQNALDAFHPNKEIFIRLGMRTDFNLGKLHSLLHYIEAIWWLGSADGFNSEYSERLHIDYAKYGYLASNRVDFYFQMARWLQRREALERHAAYIDWATSDSQSLGLITGDDDVDVDQLENADTSVTDKPTFIRSGIVQGHAYFISKSPAYHSLSVGYLRTQFGATHFTQALQTFLKGHFPDAQLQTTSLDDDRFDVYSSISLMMPSVPHIHDSHRVHKIRVQCNKPSNSPRKADSPPHFDTALIVQDRKLHREKGGLHGKVSPIYATRQPKLNSVEWPGLCAAQIRILFTLPARCYGTKFSQPLAYVEWFRPFTARDEVSGFFKVKRSTRNHHRHAEVISVSDILMPCHLVPQLAPTQVDPSWTHLNVLERASSSTFFLNHYNNLHIFDKQEVHTN